MKFNSSHATTSARMLFHAAIFKITIEKSDAIRVDLQTRRYATRYAIILYTVFDAVCVITRLLNSVEFSKRAAQHSLLEIALTVKLEGAGFHLYVMGDLHIITSY